jgi:DNA polymerase III delta subunit
MSTAVPVVYLLYGLDTFLINKSVQLINAAASLNNQEMQKETEITKFDNEIKSASVISAARTPNMFGQKRVLVYTLPEKLFAADMDVINTYLSNPNQDNILILILNAEKNTSKISVSNLIEINCNPMDRQTAKKLIMYQEIKPKSITDGGAEYLIDATNGNFALINNELNKIKNYYDKELIDTADVMEFITKTEEFEIYEFASALISSSIDNSAASNNLQKADRILSQLVNKIKPDEHYIIFGATLSQLRRVFYAAFSSASEETLAKHLACSPYAIKYARRDYPNAAPQIARLYETALDLEYKIKSGQIYPIYNALVLLFAV